MKPFNGPTFKTAAWLIGSLVLAGSETTFALTHANTPNGRQTYPSSSPSASPSASPTASPSPFASPSTSPSASSLTLQSQTGAQGTYLTDNTGKSVYVFSLDTIGVSNCTGTCATAWPPVPAISTSTSGSSTSATPSPSGSPATSASPSSSPTTSASSSAVDTALIGSLVRSDGTTQATYNGMPLYYYSGDTSAGQTNGEGLNAFGGIWSLVTPTGTPLVSSSTSVTPSPTPSASPSPYASSSPSASGNAGQSATTTTPATSTTGCTVYSDAYGNLSYAGNCANVVPSATSSTSGCVITTDAYGNVTYSGACSNTATTFTGCSVSYDAYGNIVYTGTCANAVPFAGCAAYTDIYGNVLYSGSCAASNAGTYFQGFDAVNDANGSTWYVRNPGRH